ncbi:cation channel sperm-associated protein 4-like [Amia ocellicauda]|uniref:cation channel sperm-associated protein 4-like n=1 Tax=Amia ocellicauda TaxID=2972642 RepID=UPI0034641247
MIGGSIFFLLYMMCVTFILVNLLVAVISTNLQMLMAIEDEEKAKKESTQSTQAQEQAGVGQQEEEVREPETTQRQTPHKHRRLPNLNHKTLAALKQHVEDRKRNMREYYAIRAELNRIVAEVKALPINQKKVEEREMGLQRAAALRHNLLHNDVATGRSGDMLSTLLTLDAANVTDLGAASPSVYTR